MFIKILFGAAAALGVAIALAYVFVSPVYVPYIAVGGKTVYSDIYAHFDSDKIGENFDSYFMRNEWVKDYLETDHRFPSELKDRLTGDEEYVVEFDISYKNQGALILKAKEAVRMPCLFMPYKIEKDKKVFLDGSGPVGFYAGSLVGGCNHSGTLLEQVKATFNDFVYYDVLRCFGGCYRNGGVVINSRISASDKNIIKMTIKTFLKKRFPEMGMNPEPIEEADVVFTDVIKVNGGYFIEFDVISYFYGNMGMSAFMKKDGGKYFLHDYNTPNMFKDYAGFK